MTRRTKADNRAKRLEALAMLDQNISISQISKHTGLSRNTIAKWRDEDRDKAEIVVQPDARSKTPQKTESVRSIKKRMEDTLEQVVLDGFGRAREEMENLDGYKSALVAGIAFDKMRLLRGESTSNHAHVIGSLAEGRLD